MTLIAQRHGLTPEVTAGLPSRGIRTLLRALTPQPLILILEHTDDVPQECIAALLELSLDTRNLLLVLSSEHGHEKLFNNPDEERTKRFLEHIL